GGGEHGDAGRAAPGDHPRAGPVGPTADSLLHASRALMSRPSGHSTPAASAASGSIARRAKAASRRTSSDSSFNSVRRAARAGRATPTAAPPGLPPASWTSDSP